MPELQAGGGGSGSGSRTRQRFPRFSGERPQQWMENSCHVMLRGALSFGFGALDPLLLLLLLLLCVCRFRPLVFALDESWGDCFVGFSFHVRDPDLNNH